MTPKEQEVAIGELEERVDRLRTLYEQYFLGFEKLEPTVPRKDVDRRFAILRKEQIRNTALRFRLSVVTQKFNTYSMHWVRICRQIEDGTYKRHVRRAHARFGDKRAAERDISIDVDLGDFEDLDVDAVLAEADAAAAEYQRDDASDTVPPPPPPASTREDVGHIPHLVVATPGTAFVVPGRAAPPAQPEAAQSAGMRAARPAALPAGAKPRVLRKVARGPEEAAPASQRAMPDAIPPSTRTPPPHSAPRVPAAERHDARPGSSPDLSRAPNVRPRIAPLPGSAGKIPVAAPSAGRVPVAAPPRAPAPPPPSSDPMGEKDTIPPPSMGPRSVPPGRPRAPLPLPSQISRKKKD
ncbi:MAG: hypothetical protein KF819_03745 [Labilithrix sp.]|nr:hypothetical protein [Labilithrix sp.]